MKITIVNCFDTYEQRVELLKRTLEAAGHRVRVVVSNFRHRKKTMRTECPPGYELVEARPYARNLSAARLRSHRAFARAALARAAESAPDLLWVLVPPNSLVREAALFKRAHQNTLLVLDFIDLWPESMPMARLKNTPPFWAWRALRDRYADAADLVAAECGMYREVLERSCGQEKLRTLYLARDIPLLPSAAKPPEDRIALCYLGSINNIIDIPRIGKLIAELDMPVELHVIGEGERRAALCRTAEAAGAAVIFHGEVYDPREKQAVFDRCHAGLNMMKDSVYVGLTMKSMDYFAASLPVVNTIRGDTWELIERYGVGVNYAAGTRITGAALRALQGRRARVRAFYDACFSEPVFAAAVRAMLRDLEKRENREGRT